MEPVLSEGNCIFGVDERIYPLEATMKAAYMFLDSCYVFLYHDSNGILRVRLKPKPDSQVDLANLSSEFLNELLNQSVRQKVALETRNLRELIMARALYTEALETTLLPAPIHSASSAEDSLGIAQDWFESQANSIQPI